MIFHEDLKSFTAGFGVIKTDINSFSECFLEWQNSIIKQYGMLLKITEPKEKEHPLLNLLPLSAPARIRYVFLEGKNKTTIFYDNFRRGTDAAGPIKVMSGKLNTRAYRVVSRKHEMPTSYGATILEVYENRETIRSIYAANDGGQWKFGEYGEPFSFEDIQAYDNRRITDRFNRGMLIEYLQELNLHPFSEDWYTGKFILLEKTGKLPETMQYFNPE